jgi:hypothetical protein
MILRDVAKPTDWMVEQSGFEPQHRKIAREFGGLFCFD